jgi:hypothetical protein
MENNNFTYSEAIEKVMLGNGYFAPLKLLYKEIWKFKDKSKIKGKTPDFTIMERVQRDPRFTKIGLGVYALTDCLNKLNMETKASLNLQTKEERKHAKIQGMLIEIGNSRKDIEHTYTNDKNWVFENKTLGSLTTLKEVPFFTYENIIKHSVKYADVIWFNKRGFPNNIFEVEQSTDFRDAFIKFSELQDFTTQFCCISEEKRKEKFNKELNKTAFSSIKERCLFFSYEEVENDYKIALSKTFI